MSLTNSIRGSGVVHLAGRSGGLEKTIGVTEAEFKAGLTDLQSQYADLGALRFDNTVKRGRDSHGNVNQLIYGATLDSGEQVDIRFAFGYHGAEPDGSPTDPNEARKAYGYVDRNCNGHWDEGEEGIYFNGTENNSGDGTLDDGGYRYGQKDTSSRRLEHFGSVNQPPSGGSGEETAGADANTGAQNGAADATAANTGAQEVDANTGAQEVADARDEEAPLQLSETDQRAIKRNQENGRPSGGRPHNQITGPEKAFLNRAAVKLAEAGVLDGSTEYNEETMLKAVAYWPTEVKWNEDLEEVRNSQGELVGYTFSGTRDGQPVNMQIRYNKKHGGFVFYDADGNGTYGGVVGALTPGLFGNGSRTVDDGRMELVRFSDLRGLEGISVGDDKLSSAYLEWFRSNQEKP